MAHLCDLDMEVSLALPGISHAKNIPITFVFSPHCYTRGLEEDEAPEIECGLIHDGPVHTPRYRVFDLERYQLSFQIKGLLKNLISKAGKVYEGNMNVFTTEVIANDGRRINYVIFLKARKIKELKKLEVHVESAYPYDPADPPFSRKKPQGVVTHLTNKWVGR